MNEGTRMGDGGPNGFTVGELGRAMQRLTAEIENLRKDLDRRFISREVHEGDIRRLNERQDTYQKQTDNMLQGIENEIHTVRHDIVAEIEDMRKTARENRRWFLTSLIAPLTVTVVAALILYGIFGSH